MAGSKLKRRFSTLFTQGYARAPYKRKWEDMMSNPYREPDDAPQPGAKKKKSCDCSVALGAQEQHFKAIKVTGTVLKKRQRYKAKGNADYLHRDLKAQNAWLLTNIFDASGNYLYCVSCIVSILCVREKRLARLRKVKRGELPAEHKLSGKPSHRAKTDLKANFLAFVDASRANGHRVGSSSPEYYFDAMFSTFCSPDKKDQAYETKVRRSVVGCFNLAQKANNLPTVGNTSAREWLKKERQKTAICPPKSDYCDMCKEYCEEISRAQTIANRMVESGNAEATALQQQKDLGESYKLLLASHKATAQGCIDEYKRNRQQNQSDWQ